MNIPGFALENRYMSHIPALARESMAIYFVATMDKIPIRIIPNPKDVPEDWIPSGTVKYGSKIICSRSKLAGRKITPDYYPDFLTPHLHRKVWLSNEWPLGKRVFIKPADQEKRFNGFITNKGYKGKKRGPYWCSDPVTFTNEWRYYVANGKVLTGEWYQGDEQNTPDAPELRIDIPPDYCGALDFGTLETGELALVEANHPFACGWYGKDHRKYVEFLYWGWRYMRRKYE